VVFEWLRLRCGSALTSGYPDRIAHSMDPVRLLLASRADWLAQKHRAIRVLREQRLRLNTDQRRRLAAKAKSVGCRSFRGVATIVTHETLPAGHPKLIAAKILWQPTS
jgi:hypothetical protein